MKVVRKVVDLLINSNLLIAFAAVFQCTLTYIILENDVNYYILLIEGCSTLLLYNYSLLASRPKNPQNSPFHRTRWFFSHLRWVYSVSIISIVIIIYGLMHIYVATWIYLGLIGALSIVYGLPVFKINGDKVGARQIPGLKVFYISILWSLSGVGLPAVEIYFTKSYLDFYLINYLGISKVIFLLICTLPFDIRDMKSDQLYGLKTLPLLIGAGNSKLLCYALLCIHVFMVIFSPYILPVKIGLLLTNLLIVVFYKDVVFTHKSNYKTVYVLDFVLILQCVFVYIFAWFM